MKKNEFRIMVKEIIKEVITEMDFPGEDEADKPADMTDIPQPTNKTDKPWRGKMRTLAKIKDEPGFQSKLKNLRQRAGDEPLTHKTAGQSTNY
jgi:hypothetical protein